ncbi:MAG: polyphosphate polymerase domain-containing protein [bacterium]|nr:polyphosphate polymerase domain-containing protein [bacterium]
MIYQEGWRHELKFRLPVSIIPRLREAFMPFVEHDAFCAKRPKNRYTVRSIYYDSNGLDFFFEKKDGLEVRKKLRVRTYDSPGDHDHAFIEIKRKHGRYGFKDRLKMPLDTVAELLDTNNDDWESVVTGLSKKRILSRMREMSKRMDLKPQVLVTYDREALLGLDNSRNRVTFDCNIRALDNPTLEDIYSEDMTSVINEEFVLELKFDEWMPSWMGCIIRDFALTVGNYSKYCNGVEACWQEIDLERLAALEIPNKSRSAHG